MTDKPVEQTSNLYRLLKCAVESQKNDSRTDEQIIKDGVAFIIGDDAKPADLTIESCVELAKEKGAKLYPALGRDDKIPAQIHFGYDELLAYSQALEARVVARLGNEFEDLKEIIEKQDAELATLRQQVEQLSAEVHHWKSNHDNRVVAELQASNARMASFIKEIIDSELEFSSKGIARILAAGEELLSAYDPAWLEAERAEVRRKALEEDDNRLNFVLSNSAFIVSKTSDAGGKTFQLWTQDEDEEYHVLHDKQLFFKTPREAVDAAMCKHGYLAGCPVCNTEAVGAEQLCEDEGCPHHGTPHVCVTKPVDLTIDSCAELAEEIGAMGGTEEIYNGSAENPPVGYITTYSFEEGQLLAYSRALTASLQQQISMDTECIERLRNKALALEVDIAGLQAIIAKKDEALRNLHKVCQIALEGKDGTQHAYFETRFHTFVSAVEVMEGAEQALALAFPAAALEAVRVEDKAKLARYENMEPVAYGVMLENGKFATFEDATVAAYSRGITTPLTANVEALFTHPKE